MNIIEREAARRHLKSQEVQETIGGKIAADYVKQHGNWEKHRDAIFEKIDRSSNPVFPEKTPTDEELQMNEILKNY